VLVLFIVSTAGLHYLASLLVGGDSSAYRRVLVQTILPNVAFVQQDGSGTVPGPSMGLHWYMFVQMFDRFRPYFTVFVSGIPAMFVIPLTIRLHRYPSVLVSSCISLVIFWFPFHNLQTVIILCIRPPFERLPRFSCFGPYSDQLRPCIRSH
jgi:phosphatidylinositol glycan class U